MKPMTAGFEADTLLRSVESPQKVYFRVGVPEGASLVQAKDGSGAVEVLQEGTAIAAISAPSAVDAAGTMVPVSMSVSGKTLALSVADHSGEYQYPVEVDPTVDTHLAGSEKVTYTTCVTKPKGTNWFFCAEKPSNFTSTGWGGSEGLTDKPAGSYLINEHAYFTYEAHGESSITKASVKALLSDKNDNIVNTLMITDPKKTEKKELPESNETSTWYTVESGAELGSNATFMQTAVGSGTTFSNTISNAEVTVSQTNGPTAGVNTSGRIGPYSGSFEVTSKDPGVGISYLSAKASSGGWESKHAWYEEGLCAGVYCAGSENEVYGYNTKLPNGEDTVEVVAKDAVGLEGKATAKVKVDAVAPHGLVLTGLPANSVIDEESYHVRAQASDGSESEGKPSAGIKSIKLAVNGQEVLGKASGSCTPGPCTASGEWNLLGDGLGAGKDMLLVIAEDYAGNVEVKKYEITVRHSSPEALGPGSVNPTTGAFDLSATDATVGGPAAALTVTRSYDSRQLTAGAFGPLGPQWTLGVGVEQKLVESSEGSVTVVAAGGGATTFVKNSKGEYEAPFGDENLTLSHSGSEFLLKDPTAGTTTKFSQPTGAPERTWPPAAVEGVVSAGNMTYTYTTVEVEGAKVAEPAMELAPVPAGVSCGKEMKELKAGCRALIFSYAETTKGATGEGPGEWGEYKGRLSKVSFMGYSPVTKKMLETPVAVAEYHYDKTGRLRAEWDPRISPSLQTSYGYDAEGHVTAISPPGRQPWLVHYGGIASDPSSGRALSIVRPAASSASELKEAKEKPAPVNTGVPTLSSTSPEIGVTLKAASNGAWSNSPQAYSYQWEDCTGSVCNPIPGAVNEGYTPQAHDAGYTLVLQVSATNADGSTVASSAASSPIAMPADAYSSTFGGKGKGEGLFEGPTGVAVDASGGASSNDIWVADRANNRVERFSPLQKFEHEYAAEGLSKPAGLAINQGTEDVYVSNDGVGANDIVELGPEGKYIRKWGHEGKGDSEFKEPAGVAVDSAGNVWVSDRGNNRIQEFTGEGAFLGVYGSEGTGTDQFKGPVGIAFSGEELFVSDSGSNRVLELSSSGAFIQAFGWGVSNGKTEFQACTSSLPGRPVGVGQRRVLNAAGRRRGPGDGRRVRGRPRQLPGAAVQPGRHVPRQVRRKRRSTRQARRPGIRRGGLLRRRVRQRRRTEQLGRGVGAVLPHEQSAARTAAARRKRGLDGRLPGAALGRRSTV